MYGYMPLSDEQKGLLDDIDFPWYPGGGQQRSWYEKYDELVEFRKQHGHFVVDRKDNPSLWRWIDNQRNRRSGVATNARPLSRSQVYLLEQIGFAWTTDRHGMEWQRRYDGGSLDVTAPASRCFGRPTQPHDTKQSVHKVLLLLAITVVK